MARLAARLTSAIVALTFALGTGTALRAQAPDTLAVAIGRALSEERLVGATWALVYSGHTELGAAGLRDVARSTPISAHDRVQMGSVAKTFTALGVLRLVTEGRVDVDAPVAQYLLALPIANPWESTTPLTVRHLLDHTGGLDDARMWQAFSLRADPAAPLRSGLLRDGQSLRVRHRPGDRFSYSNSSYLALGMLIESVTGMRYEAWIETELLVPLGMTHTTAEFVTQSGPQADSSLAMGHFDWRSTSASVPTLLRPATQITTTAADMARLARFLMSDGRVGARVLIDSTLLRAMSTVTTTEASRAGLAAGYALGLARRDRHGVVGRCHLGNQGNFRAALCLYPGEQRAFFIAYNVDPENANFDRIDGMLVSALGMTTLPEPVSRPLEIDPSEWDGLYIVRPNRFVQFAYLDELGGLLRVRWDGAALQLRPLQGAPRTLLPAGGTLLRDSLRREPTHALMRTQEGAFVISDGFRSFERVSPLRIALLWAGALWGIAAILYLFVAGVIRMLRTTRNGNWRSQPLRWPAFCIALILAAPLLYLTQSFLALGDPTPASLALAVLTAAFPFTLLIAVVHRVRAGLTTTASRVDLAALGGALQWCGTLAFWGLLPLALWR